MESELSARRLRSRIEDHIRAWNVIVERMVDTESSVLAFGQRDRQPVVLKVVKHTGDEWHSGRVLEAFGGTGVVRALEYVPGAVLLERLSPGLPLSDVDEIGDQEATEILAEVIGRMSPAAPPDSASRVEAWAGGFAQYAARGMGEVPMTLVESAHLTYTKLCASQSTTRLLHGDLHHHNVLLDARRGWLAIDPKGVVGEVAFEIGAALRNPCARPAVYAAPAAIERRVKCFAGVLGLDPERVLLWAFAQAVLAAIWEIEDAGVLGVGKGWIALASVISAMLPGRG